MEKQISMSWAAPTPELPIDHLPYGIVCPPGDRPRVAVAVGDGAIDLASLCRAGIVRSIDEDIAEAATLNPLIDRGPETWTELRAELADVLAADRRPQGVTIHRLHEVTTRLPIEVADYVDFYSSIEHATNLGRLFRPDSEPLLPNWRHLPIGYHGRAGTVVVSGTSITRPSGQQKAPDEPDPTFGPSRRLDIELELGAILHRSEPGRPVAIDDANRHIFGVVLVNDWSARDIQAWEYQPLGPFLGKSFATSISAWVVPFAAIEQFSVPAPQQDPTPLHHLRSEARSNLDIHLEVAVSTAGSAPGATGQSGAEQVIATTNSRLLYWTFAQQIAHMTSNGAALRTGDLIATGTISGAAPDQVGSLIERTANGTQPILVNGTPRSFLADGDTVTLRGRFGGPDGPQLGPCSGTIAPALEH
jgi:fumarylacetoacetase